MLMNNTPTINYWSLKSEEKLPKPKLKSKYSSNINNSKRSFASTSKSRSSAKGVNKDFNQLITKSKLRLSGKISKPESATGKYTTIASDMKIQKLEEMNLKLMTQNELLKSENLALRKKLELFANCNIDDIVSRYPLLASAAESMEELYSSAASSLISEREACTKIYQEYTLLTREKEKDVMNAEMNQNYLETKNSLLKEVLTKRNKDMDEVEKGNKQLMSILEKYDEKMDKMKEQIEVQQLKIEKYEEQISGKIKKIDIHTIDGRINFLVDILEDYKRQLEEMEEEGEESEEEHEGETGLSKILDDSKVVSDKAKLRDLLGDRKENGEFDELEIPLDVE